ncbi:MAG: Tellurite resistance protein TerB [Deltaproteobacteria bacterium ADurb.Bin510]|nr:MAG: Tellurite resistance protein TerB [Deltaproteobacteria bacterium ADurb.Bin510]
MIRLMKRVFGVAARPDEAGPSVALAAGALLIEMAASDGEFSAVERETILAVLRREHGLGEDEAAEMLELAEAERSRSIDLWSFTSRLNRELDRGAKLRLIEMVWEVIYADERLDGYEDYLVHRLAELLNLHHEELIAAKLKVLKGQA